MNSDQQLTTVTESTFQFTVENVSEMKKAVSSSPVICQHLPWNIVVKPNFDLGIGKQPLGFFIICDGNASSNWQCQAEVEFRLYHHKKNRKPFTRKFSHLFCTRDNTVGIENFLLWEEVIDSINGYAKDGSLTFEVCVMPELPDDKKAANFSVTEVVFRHTLKNILNINKSVQLGPFTACDFAWRITVKPPNKLLPDKPHSLGLHVQCNKEVFSNTWTCNARVELRLLSQKKIQEKLYRILQHQFSSKNNMSGVEELLLWKDLLNEDKGFIKNDSITVEVHVIPDKFNLKAYLNVTEATFWYTFENVSKINVSRLSPPCFIGNLTWRIKILPNKPKEGLQHSLFGCYIYCNEGNKSKIWNCNAIGELRIVSHKDGKASFTRKLLPHHFDAQHNNWGFDCFMLWKDVINPGMGFINNGSITVEACIRIITEPSETILIP